MAQRPASIMITGPAEWFLRDPEPSAVGAGPVAAGVGAPSDVIDDQRLPDISVVRGFKPVSIRRERVVKRSVIAHRRGVVIVHHEVDGTAAGEFAFLVAEIAVAGIEIGFLLIQFGSAEVHLAFADGEFLFAFAEKLGLLLGGVLALAFERGAFLLDLDALALEGVALGGDFLFFELAFQLQLPVECLVGFLFKRGDFVGNVRGL